MTVRNAGCALVRVFNYIVISVMSISTEITLNLILTVLRYCTIILLTLVVSHKIAFLRVDINVVILII